MLSPAAGTAAQEKEGAAKSTGEEGAEPAPVGEEGAALRTLQVGAATTDRGLITRVAGTVPPGEEGAATSTGEEGAEP